MLIEIFDNHNNQMAQLVGKDCAEGTLQRYLTARSHTVAFLQWKFKASDIDILDLSHEFATEFEFWLKSVKHCGHNTSMKYISNMKKIVNICLRNGWLPKDPFMNYKMTKREVVREVLTQEEIDTLANKSFATTRVAIVRDLFLFSCYTGLAYADIKKLKRSEISNGVDGESGFLRRGRKQKCLHAYPCCHLHCRSYRNMKIILYVSIKTLYCPCPATKR